ncbi:MAG: helix-turn-helix domain-containing protein [Lachnospiraceae bacterium]|nr:helix-turn-helix domain-containing protein [Lachnospiraceae bacterium]
MNIYEKLRRSQHKNNNEMEKEMTVAELVKKLNQKIDGKKLDRNVINRIEAGQEPNLAQLVAYSKVFNVSTDYILNNISPKSDTETIKSIADYLGLSDATIEEIAELKPDYKMIFDKMISKYCFLLILSEIRNLLGYNYLRPHLTLQFDEKRKWLDGAEIDQVLNNAVNDNAVSVFFNEAVNKRIEQIVENVMNDKELQEYFGELDKHSKIQTVPLSAEFLPKLGTLKKKGSDENETT